MQFMCSLFSIDLVIIDGEFLLFIEKYDDNNAFNAVIKSSRFFNVKKGEQALADAGVITYGSNVKEVTTQVSEATVDAGVVYCTDAFSAGLAPVAYATKDMCKQIIYPAAVMKNALHPEAAKSFLDFCFTDEAMAVFTAVGFEKVA